MELNSWFCFSFFSSSLLLSHASYNRFRAILHTHFPIFFEILFPFLLMLFVRLTHVYGKLILFCFSHSNQWKEHFGLLNLSFYSNASFGLNQEVRSDLEVGWVTSCLLNNSFEMAIGCVYRGSYIEQERVDTSKKIVIHRLHILLWY